MQNTRKQMTISPPSVPLQTRPATDFSIEAIMGRSTDQDRPSPQMATTAECAGAGTDSPKGMEALRAVLRVQSFNYC